MRPSEKVLFFLAKKTDVSEYETRGEEWNLDNALSVLCRECMSFMDDIVGKEILDFGCKLGWQTIATAKNGVKFRNDGAKKYEESGLNKMNIGKFKRIISNCGLEIQSKKYSCVKNINFLRKIPIIRELFINHVSCVLAHR